MLRLEHVVVTYNAGTSAEVPALRGISMELEAGSFTTLVGSNGAGKSSLIGVISGAVTPNRGRVIIGGTDVTYSPDHRRAARVARVFDNPHAGTCPELSIADNLALAFSRGRKRRLRFAQSQSRTKLMRDRLATLGLGLEDRLEDPVTLLSAGQRQSLTMVMAGLQPCDVLLLDEHLAALDPATAVAVLKLTVELTAEMGSAALMVTHNMDHAIATGQRMLIMGGGRLIGDLQGAQKKHATVQDVINVITQSGGSVSDRSILDQGLTL